MNSTLFSTSALLDLLSKLPDCRHYWVAYSGGRDSHVLLAAMAAVRNNIPAKISALHVNHHINENADAWATRCKYTCNELGIKFELVEFDISCPQGQSIESWSRDLRYQLMEKEIGPGDILLTAHHKDDQAETLLLQLLRGAGPKGLSAMPLIRQFGKGFHARPLINFTRQQLGEYAEQNKLHWIEDGSNTNTDFDRNFLRHRVFPVLNERWPTAIDTLSRVTVYQSEAAEILEEIAIADVERISSVNTSALNISKLKELPWTRQKNAIRYWLKQQGFAVPSAKKLEHIFTNVMLAREDSVPCISWNNVEIRRYRNKLFAIHSLPAIESHNKIRWDLSTPIPVSIGELIAEPTTKGGLTIGALSDNNQVEIGYRIGGETIKPVGRHHHHTLKKLLQERGVPPWYRDRIPLLYINGQLAVVPGLWIDENFYADSGHKAMQIAWTGLDKIL